MRDKMKYSTKILDMGILLEMESLLNTHGGVSRCIMECRQLAGEVCHSQQLLDKLSYIDDWLCRFSSIMYHRFDEKQIKWREEVDRDYPRKKVYILNPDNIPFREDNIKKSASNASKITVSVTVSKLCASQKEFDDFLTLAEKLKENSPGH
ncbi:hypothetical protein JZM22_21255 [Escherichia coli]|nr:hypothetical protein [Escherichia coli]MBN6421784.1 hypothetical protein [Escherichia coli]